MHSAADVAGMPDSTNPRLFVFMDAYKVLGLDYSADSSVIRRAHRRLARTHHPDKHPAGSSGQQQATVRMAEINDAYRLVRDAPLRYHRVSKATAPDTAWTDIELVEAIRRGHANRRVDLAMTIGGVALAMIIMPIIVSSIMPAVALAGPLSFPLIIVLTLGSSLAMYTLLGPRMWHMLFMLQLLLGFLHRLASAIVP
jgi:hypothetical protein